MNLSELKTPCLLLDINRVRRNAARIGDRAIELGVNLRPHVKTHKCIELARIQTAGHSGALTVSTLAEARVFADHDFRNITYSVPIEPGKFLEAIELSKQCEVFSVITDSADIPELLNEQAKNEGVNLSVFLKVDCGYHRCGVDPGSPEALEIPQQISASSNLSFAGILTHAGHSYHCRSKQDLLAVARHERDVMTELAFRLRNTLPVPTVSIGSTPTISSVDHLEGIDEIRPGNYILFDAFQATLGSCTFEDCALTVLAAVVHRDRHKVIIDAGALALSKDRGPIEFDPDCGYGRILNLEGKELPLRFDSLSQEHGILTATDTGFFDQLKVGTRLRVLANHSCLTAAQHPFFNVLEDGQIVDRWKIHSGW